MSNTAEKLTGSEETQNDSLVRGGIGFFGGLLLCTAALLAQAALLHSISDHNKKSN
jgi:hypothetical protein